MRRILFSLLSVAFICGVVQGYVLFLDAPTEIRAGAPLIVNGTTTFPAGDPRSMLLTSMHELPRVSRDATAADVALPAGFKPK